MNDTAATLLASDDEEIAALRAIVRGNGPKHGRRLFQVSGQASCLRTRGELRLRRRVRRGGDPRPHSRLLGQGLLRENIEFDLAGTPCEDVVRGNLCHHPLGVQAKFPRDLGLVKLGIESYLGVPLLDGEGNVLGHLAVFDERPMPSEPRRLFIFRIFAARAAVELERLWVEQRLVESERRYRDLYEEAPNAYVSVGVDLRLSNVNRRGRASWLFRR